MSNKYLIFAKVESIQGKFMRGHSPGEEWRFTQKTPEGICMGAFSSVLPAIRTLQSKGALFWQKELHVTKISCIDPVNTVSFRIERLEESCAP